MSDEAVKMICNMLESIAPWVFFCFLIYLKYKSDKND